MKSNRMLMSAIVMIGFFCFIVCGDLYGDDTKKIPARGTRAKGPGANLKNVIIWGSECREPEGKGLAFGGMHQRSADGRPHTRIFQEDKWVPINEELRKNNPLQKHKNELWNIRTEFKNTLGKARYIFFEGKTDKDERAWFEKEVNPVLKKLAEELNGISKTLGSLSGLEKYEKGQVKFVLDKIKLAQPQIAPLKGISDATILKGMRHAQVKLEIAAEALGSEPPPRVCSKVVYDAKTKLYIIFGGDHFDYLSNDVWVFDPAKKKWEQKHPNGGPQPRAAHTAASGDGKVHVSAGIAYRSHIGYMAPCYQHMGGVEWVYDIAADTWTGPAGETLFSSDSRSYRTGPYAPEFYMKGERPNAAANEAKLKSISVNTWVAMKPPKRYEKNRDWGTSVIDPDHDLFLQWSGGHSSYGATDVAHYHFATNRWEITFPVELPLGLNYSNSNYPGGFNFNLRPWMTGHTYKGYAYSTELRQLVLVVRTHQWEYAHDPYFYLYDPLIGDWTARYPKHKNLSYVKNMYTTIVCRTPHGMAAWARGNLLLFDNTSKKWKLLKLKGTIPSVGVDSSGMIYDPKRDRLLIARSAHWKKPDYNGQIYAVDMKNFTASPLSPADCGNAFGAFIREGVYHSGADLFVWGRRGNSGQTIAYNPEKNCWIKFNTTGNAPFGYSTGHVYDPKRELLWVVDSRANIWCMRLDPKTAIPNGLPDKLEKTN